MGGSAGDRVQSIPGGRRIRLDVGHIAALALVLRLVHLAAVAPGPLFHYHETFVDSDIYIFDQWARRIVAGDVLGREPFHYLAAWELHHAPAEKWARWFGEAPVFYKAPAYAYLVALLYGFFGEPMLPLALLQVLASTVAVILLFRITERLFGRAAGMAAALVLALYAPAIHFDVTMLRGTWIAVTSLATTWALLQVRARPGAKRGLVLGLAMGVALLFNEAFLPAAVLAAGCLAAWFPGRARWVVLAGYVAGFALALMPVVVRNHLVGAPLLQFAVLGGTAYAICNTAGASPYFFDMQANYVPLLEASGGSLGRIVLGCLRTFDGPLELVLFYAKRMAGLIVPYENPDNVNFYYVALRSPILNVLPGWATLWPAAVIGLALVGRRLRPLLPLAPAGLTLLLSIVLTVPMARYRAVFAVFLMPLAGLALASGAAWIRDRRVRPLVVAGGAGALIVLGTALLQSHLVFGGRPRNGFLYRPAEFWLGASFYEGRGRLAEAAREVLDLARLNPSPRVKAMALAKVGELEARRGNTAVAREALAAARLLGADDAGLLLTVGDSQARALGDKAEAATTYGMAASVADPALQANIRDRLRTLEASPAPRRP